uniref:Uncharacterized protein n=1 Tax=Chromera velia CCMP2878 TaxID=1169474 RepID=A0A0G4HG31_9ALVE|eukprot:Cvel_27225.t1-p1 / transcript=Cvel_27225.t1 / gene=Cvel_27225 / organism=Chromera_velia_CCMP2878 / gene_product=hypothetical protein / transcript_product=hypothetical protein / location=Cvel_scaffold3367:5076-8830(-) / protein_length=66 / sequence_SO=supercontig / SO=protein_coding / is_pseudo=false
MGAPGRLAFRTHQISEVPCLCPVDGGSSACLGSRVRGDFCELLETDQPLQLVSKGFDASLPTGAPP